MAEVEFTRAPVQQPPVESVTFTLNAYEAEVLGELLYSHVSFLVNEATGYLGTRLAHELGTRRGHHIRRSEQGTLTLNDD